MTSLYGQVILLRLQLGHFALSRHSEFRMEERGIDWEDIMAVGSSGSCFELEYQKWIVRGKDRAGGALTVVVAWRSGVFIVTLY